jgi:broad specificity phosphatase PhoE
MLSKRAEIGYHSQLMDPSASPFRIFLIRHGETEWNHEDRWQGHSDVALNAAGRDQATRLARRLAETGTRFDRLYSSDLRRAWETAEPIGAALELRPIAAPALREIDLGVWAGKTRAEIARAFPQDWARLQTGEDFRRGGGETFAVFQRRVLNWLEGVARDRPGRTICAVTHGGCVRAILLHALSLGWIDRRQIPSIRNASVSILEQAPDGWNILTMNETAELPTDGNPAAPTEPEGETS